MSQIARTSLRRIYLQGENFLVIVFES